MTRPSPRTLGYVVAWLGAATVAVAVGVFAVSGVGASVRDRGPITGEEQAVRAALDSERVATPAADSPRTVETFRGDYGRFEVTCRGAVAYPDGVVAAPGWRRVSYEPGPDDDVDVIFASGDRSTEIEVYCDAGTPTVSDREDKTLPDD